MADGDVWLGPRERVVLAGLQVAKRRADWRLGRWTAKQAVLAAEASPRKQGQVVAAGALATLELLAAGDGAPGAWRGEEPMPVTVSWSHRAGRAVAAVTGAETAVGVDLELLEARSAAFLDEWFSPAERAWVGDDTVVRANLLWTAKEAAAKVRREGLRLDVRALLVSVPDAATSPVGGVRRDDPAAAWAPVSVAEPNRAHHPPLRGWWVITDGFVATVLTDPPTPPPALPASG